MRTTKCRETCNAYIHWGLPRPCEWLILFAKSFSWIFVWQTFLVWHISSGYYSLSWRILVKWVPVESVVIISIFTYYSECSPSPLSHTSWGEWCLISMFVGSSHILTFGVWKPMGYSCAHQFWLGKHRHTSTSPWIRIISACQIPRCAEWDGLVYLHDLSHGMKITKKPTTIWENSFWVYMFFSRNQTSSKSKIWKKNGHINMGEMYVNIPISWRYFKNSFKRKLFFLSKILTKTPPQYQGFFPPGTSRPHQEEAPKNHRRLNFLEFFYMPRYSKYGIFTYIYHKLRPKCR